MYERLFVVYRLDRISTTLTLRRPSSSPPLAKRCRPGPSCCRATKHAHRRTRSDAARTCPSNYLLRRMKGRGTHGDAPVLLRLAFEPTSGAQLMFHGVHCCILPFPTPGMTSTRRVVRLSLSMFWSPLPGDSAASPSAGFLSFEQEEV